MRLHLLKRNLSGALGSVGLSGCRMIVWLTVRTEP